MSVSISCPQLGDAGLRSQLTAAVRDVVRRWRPAFESWRLSLFKSQSGSGWDLAISGPRFRKVFTLNGPVEDLPGLVSPYIDAILAQLSDPRRTIPNHGKSLSAECGKATSQSTSSIRHSSISFFRKPPY